MKKLLVVLSVVAAGGFFLKLWTGAGGGDREATEPRLVLNRIWLDHLPRGDRDRVNAFAALTRQPLGFFQSATRWKGSYELFQHESTGDQLRIVFPETGEKERVRARAWTCKEGDMDYCLELTGSSRGVRRYHSRKGWELGASASSAQARAQIESLQSSESTAPR